MIQSLGQETCTYVQQSVDMEYADNSLDMHYIAGFSNLTHILVMYSGDTSTHILCTRILVHLNSNECDAEEVRSCADTGSKIWFDEQYTLLLINNTQWQDV